MSETEIPEYFICPISFQIMNDPVTTITGITYDRESIQQWLLKGKNCICPVTKQPLPRSSEFLTPNHTLQRLIQAWSSSNKSNGSDQIPPPTKTHLQKLLNDLEIPQLLQITLEKMHSLALESERNRTCMVEAGVVKGLIKLINSKILFGDLGFSKELISVKCRLKNIIGARRKSKNNTFKQENIICLEKSLGTLHLLWNNINMKSHIGENSNFIESLTSILQIHNTNTTNHAMPLLKLTIEASDSTSLANLSFELIREIVRVLKPRDLSLSQEAIKSALQVLIKTCPMGRNRTKILEAGAVTELIELELEKPEKNITELVFNVLAQLCSCAEGRERFLRHAAGIAVITKRILRVSDATDDRGIQVLSVICKYSASKEILLEMLKVGAVSKLCMVMQADCSSHLKEKAREILRLHSNVWSNSPCIQVYLLTRHQR